MSEPYLQSIDLPLDLPRIARLSSTILTLKGQVHDERVLIGAVPDRVIVAEPAALVVDANGIVVLKLLFALRIQ